MQFHHYHCTILYNIIVLTEKLKSLSMLFHWTLYWLEITFRRWVCFNQKAIRGRATKLVSRKMAFVISLTFCATRRKPVSQQVSRGHDSITISTFVSPYKRGLWPVRDLAHFAHDPRSLYRRLSRADASRETIPCLPDSGRRLGRLIYRRTR